MKTARFMIRTVPLALVLVALVAAPAFAQHGRMGRGHGPHHGEHGPGMFLGMMAEQLNLSDEQRDRVHELMVQQHQSKAGSRDQMMEARRALADLVHAEEPDETAIRAAAAAVASAEADRMVAQAELLREIRLVLEPEQQKQMQEMIEKHQEFKGEKPRGAFGHGPHGKGDCLHFDDDSDSDE